MTTSFDASASRARSTVSGWRNRPLPTLVSVGPAHRGEAKLRAEIAKLERRVQVLTAVMTVLLALVRVSKDRLNNVRLADADDKKRLVRAARRAQPNLSKHVILLLLGVSATRFAEWCRMGADACPLEDQSKCPRLQPTQLTPDEVREMHEMATSPNYRHVPTSVLAVLAQRLGKVFASASTWCKYVRERGWRRPRRRVHPSKPTEGVRADRPDGMWHVDTSVIRLRGGPKVYLLAIIDNFSRRVLAWSVSEHLEPLANAALLVQALFERDKKSPECTATTQDLMVDGGVENFNEAVDKLVNEKYLARILAQTDVLESNSLIERFWMSAKYGWLFLNDLDSLGTVRRLVGFYVKEYNETVPHSALNVRTPSEVYFGKAVDVPEELAAARTEARAARIEANRARKCDDCRTAGSVEQLAANG